MQTKCAVKPMGNIQSTLSGKMSLERFPVINGWILKPCLKRSQRPRFQFLSLENGQNLEWLEAESVISNGERLTLNTGESPNEERESSLSQILQSPCEISEKYYLSRRACAGILHRASVKGITLPEALKNALELQASE